MGELVTTDPDHVVPRSSAREVTERLIRAKRTGAVLPEIVAERERQHAKHGDQTHVPDGTGGETATFLANLARDATDKAFAGGGGTWNHILLEEVYEAGAETDPALLRAELVQVAAVAVAWIEKLDQEAGRA